MCGCLCCVFRVQTSTHTHTEKWNAACFLFLTQHFVLGLSRGTDSFHLGVYHSVFFHSQITSESLWCFHCLPISGEQTCLRVKGIPSTQCDGFYFLSFIVSLYGEKQFNRGMIYNMTTVSKLISVKSQS